MSVARAAAGLLPLSIFAPAERRTLIERLGHVPHLVTIQYSAYEYRLLAMGRGDSRSRPG